MNTPSDRDLYRDLLYLLITREPIRDSFMKSYPIAFLKISEIAKKKVRDEREP